MENDKLKILIADDEEIIRRGLTKLLNNKGYTNITEASDGTEVLSKIDMDSTIDDFDFYILDVKMPGMDGLKLLKQIKKVRPQAKIIIITGHGKIETCRQAFIYGAIDYITKPFNIDQLYYTLDKYSNFSADSDIDNNLSSKNISAEILKLINIIYDKKNNTIIRENAVLKLGMLKDNRVVPVLLNYLSNETDIALKEKVIYVLGRLGDPVIYEKLVNILRNKNEKNDVRMAAVMALRFLGKEDITAPFIKSIHDKLKDKKVNKLPKKKSFRVNENIKVEIDDEIINIYLYNIISAEDVAALENYYTDPTTKKYLSKVFNVNINLYYVEASTPTLVEVLKEITKTLDNVVIYVTKKKTPLNEIISRYTNELNVNYL